jgi:hypothetical protein
MTTRKTFVKFMLAAYSLIASTSLQAVELLTSDGAWGKDTANNNVLFPSTNNDWQSNTQSNGAFSSYNGVMFGSSTVNEYIEMNATTNHEQQKYTAGYTYRYKSLGHSTMANRRNTFNVELLADGDLTGVKVTGNNYRGTGTDALNSNTLIGELKVEKNDAYDEKQIGMRISANGPRTKWYADGSTSLSALLTNHAGFDGGNGAGALYSTSFSGDAQAINYDHVLDMSLTYTGGAIVDDFIKFNNNGAAKNTVNFGSETDTFRANTGYKITINAIKRFSADGNQNSIDIVMGDDTHTETITVPTSATTLDFTINADDLGLAGKAFKFDISASAVTSVGENQYRIHEFSIEAFQVPEPDSFAFWAASLTLTWIMTRRRFNATKAQV